MALPSKDSISEFSLLIETILNTAAMAQVRLGALLMLQEAAFSNAVFDQVHASYLAALRNLIADPVLEIRLRAIDTLGRAKDPVIQSRLLQGLDEPNLAIVPPAHAIQLLGFDIHGPQFPLLPTIAAGPAQEAARVQALRFLAADPESLPLLRRLLKTKTESRAVRVAAAVSLLALDREVYAAAAGPTVADATEDAQVRAVCETGLTLIASAPTA